jgi:hypothetical protein
MSTAEDIRAALRCGDPRCPCARPRGPWHCASHDGRRPSFTVTTHADRVLVHCHTGCGQPAVIAALRARGLCGGRAAKPRAPRSALESAVRELLDQRWNDVNVLMNYQLADQIRAGHRHVQAVRRAAVTDDEATWERLAQVGRVETEIHRIESELDEAQA